MKFSYSIPLTTVLVLIATIIINVVGLKLSLDTNFPEYIQRISERFKNNIEINPDGIQALLAIKNLDSATQADYQGAITELSHISSSLRSLSENPELYKVDPSKTGNNLGSGASAYAFQIYSNNTISDAYNKSILSVFSHPLGFASGSPEKKFIVSILSNFLLLNCIWITIIAIGYTIWIRRIFYPIHTILTTLKNITNFKEKSPLLYKRNNEFRPLIGAINTLQHSLSQQESIRNNFLSDISHEIRTPITAISCLLEAINDKVISLDAKTIVILQKEMNRLIQITGKIMEHENFLSSVSPNSPRDILLIKNHIDEVAMQYTPRLTKNNQKIINTISKNIVLRANPEQFSQILHNIFSNFYKYAGEGSTLTVSAKKNKKETILIFADTGEGVPVEDMENIREKFFKKETDRTQDPENISMGIGLSIVDRILLLHNAHMDISATHPHGLTLTLTFPNYVS